MGPIARNCRVKENKIPIKEIFLKKQRVGKRDPGLDRGESGSMRASSPSKEGNMRTITYGPEINTEEIISMSMKRPVLGKEINEQLMLLLVKDFTWSQQTDMALRACLNGQNVVAIVDTGSSEVVVSESCFQRLKLIHNGEIEFIILSATYTNQKNRRIMKKLEV